jgi:hypothetical protein
MVSSNSSDNIERSGGSGGGTITSPDKGKRRTTKVEAATSNSNYYYSHHNHNNNHNSSNDNDNDDDILYERKMQYMTDGLPKHFLALLQRQKSKQNVLTIANYLQAMNKEMNPSASSRQAQIQTLCYLSSYHNSQILFSEMTHTMIS